MIAKNKRIMKSSEKKNSNIKVEEKPLKKSKKDLDKKIVGSSKAPKSKQIANKNKQKDDVIDTIAIQPPPMGLAYIPSSVFNIIASSFEKEVDKFKNAFGFFIKRNNIMYNNVLDWLEVDRFIHDYIQQLSLDCKLDKFIIEYDAIDGMILLIDYYKHDLYKDIFDNETEIIHYIKSNINNTKYDMVYCIIKNLVGHKSYENIVGL